MPESRLRDVRALKFDLDETLVPCAGYYVEAEERFLDHAARLLPGAERTEIRGRFRQIDGERARGEMKYSRFRYAGSMALCLRALAAERGRALSAAEIEQGEAFGRAIFESADYTPFPGVIELLERYRDAGVPLGLYTKGDQVLQWEHKIRRHGLDRLFSVIEVVEGDKTVAEMRRLAMALGGEPGRVAMVGDSLKDDIGIGRRAGLPTIWVSAGYEAIHRSWAHDAGHEEERADAVVRTVTELPGVVPVPAPTRATEPLRRRGGR